VQRAQGRRRWQLQQLQQQQQQQQQMQLQKKDATAEHKQQSTTIIRWASNISTIIRSNSNNGSNSTK